jgi:hypothetical protein
MKVHPMPVSLPTLSTRFIGAALLWVGTLAPATAAEWLFVGTYYVRGDKDSCAQGAYVKRDAASEAELKAMAAEFMANKEYKDKRIDRYKRGQVAAIYSALSKDVNYMGKGSCTYTRFNSLSARSTAEAEKQVQRRRVDYPSSFLSDPSIVYFWQGEDVTGRQ